MIDVNYLHYLWDARQAISTSHRSVSALRFQINLVLLYTVHSVLDVKYGLV